MACGVVRKAVWTPSNRSEHGPNINGSLGLKTLALLLTLFVTNALGADQLIEIVTAPPSQHLEGLIAITIFSLVFYGVFARFREQACTLACPYGRIMSALLQGHDAAQM